MSAGNLTIELGWPSPRLSPNARGSHWPRTHAAKLAREEAFYATRAAMGAQLGPTVTKLDHDGHSAVILRQIAHPPDKRDRDRDGVDSRLKAHRDGIADATGINDKHFRPTGIEWGEPVPGGRVVVELALATGA
jgi:crossover junction endodeoxyribonuclease RusA